MQLAAASVMKEVGEWLKVTFRRKGVQVKSKVVKLFELFAQPPTNIEIVLEIQHL